MATVPDKSGNSPVGVVAHNKGNNELLKEIVAKP